MGVPPTRRIVRKKRLRMALRARLSVKRRQTQAENMNLAHVYVKNDVQKDFQLSYEAKLPTKNGSGVLWDAPGENWCAMK